MQFIFFLALHVEKTLDVEGLLERTPQRVIEQWRAFYDLRPFGDDWHQTSVLAAAAVNPHVKRAHAVKPEKLLPERWFVRRVKRKQSPEGMFAVVRQYVEATNGQRRKH